LQGIFSAKIPAEFPLGIITCNWSTPPPWIRRIPLTPSTPIWLRKRRVLGLMSSRHPREASPRKLARWAACSQAITRPAPIDPKAFSNRSPTLICIVRPASMSLPLKICEKIPWSKLLKASESRRFQVKGKVTTEGTRVTTSL
jgi:hypothetical protein